MSANILMSDEHNVKLADFGLTRKFEEITKTYTKGVGTSRFMAPEMVALKEDGSNYYYNRSVDIWAIGCIVLHMLTGKPPFPNLSEPQVIFRLGHPDPCPARDLLSKVSENCKKFFSKTLATNPRERSTADSLLKESFVTGERLPELEVNAQTEESGSMNNAHRRCYAQASLKDLPGLLGIEPNKNGAISPYSEQSTVDLESGQLRSADILDLTKDCHIQDSVFKTPFELDLSSELKLQEEIDLVDKNQVSVQSQIDIIWVNHDDSVLKTPFELDLSSELEVQEEIDLVDKNQVNVQSQIDILDLTLDDLVRPPSERDELLAKIDLVDRNQISVQRQIDILKKKKAELLESKLNNPHDEQIELLHEHIDQNFAEIIYAENLPAYHQPSDTPVYHENIQKYKDFKPRLVLHLEKRQQARNKMERNLIKRYDQLMQSWQKKTERIEKNPERRIKEAEMKEFYENIFPEIKTLREEKEKLPFSTRGVKYVISKKGNRNGQANYARRDTERERIWTEKEIEGKNEGSISFIPSFILDDRQHTKRFVNNNGLLEDALEVYKESQNYTSMWTEAERLIFKEKYLQNPKNFVVIASFLPQKSVPDCVKFYYLTKKKENYKLLLEKENVNRDRNMTDTQEQEQQHQEEESDKTSDLAQIDGKSESGTKRQLDFPRDIRKEENEKCGTAEELPANEGPLHICTVCKNEVAHYGLSQPLTSSNRDHQYSVALSDLQNDMRVCKACHGSTVYKGINRSIDDIWLKLSPTQKSTIKQELGKQHSACME
ncbi:nuclear receptor co-repressor 1 [Bulinus truncatus]|nr:nuclear receptor co-repressor 1 [Bulinus truncatus]